MPDTKPREFDSAAPRGGNRTSPSTPSRQEKQDVSVAWPRDMNSPTTKDPVWGSDPEALRDA